jgi:hypothetical protein
MTRAVAQAPGVADYLTGQGAQVEDGVYESKALEPIPYLRWDTNRSS